MVSSLALYSSIFLSRCTGDSQSQLLYLYVVSCSEEVLIDINIILKNTHTILTLGGIEELQHLAMAETENV